MVTPEGPERLTDHISLGVLTRVFPADVVDAVIGRTGALEQRNRLLPSNTGMTPVLLTPSPKALGDRSDR